MPVVEGALSTSCSHKLAMEGYDEMAFKDGGVYKGEWLRGIPHGFGTSIDPIGNQYCGQFVHGIPQGDGSHVHVNGERYSGGFRAGKQHGVGIWTHDTGDQYCGEFEDDERHAGGDKFVGSWHRGKPKKKCALPDSVQKAIADLQVYGDLDSALFYNDKPKLVAETDGVAIYGAAIYGSLEAIEDAVAVVATPLYDFSHMRQEVLKMSHGNAYVKRMSMTPVEDGDMYETAEVVASRIAARHASTSSGIYSRRQSNCRNPATSAATTTTPATTQVQVIDHRPMHATARPAEAGYDIVASGAARPTEAGYDVVASGAARPAEAAYDVVASGAARAAEAGYDIVATSHVRPSEAGYDLAAPASVRAAGDRYDLVAPPRIQPVGDGYSLLVQGSGMAPAHAAVLGGSAVPAANAPDTYGEDGNAQIVYNLAPAPPRPPRLLTAGIQGYNRLGAQGVTAPPPRPPKPGSSAAPPPRPPKP